MSQLDAPMNPAPGQGAWRPTAATSTWALPLGVGVVAAAGACLVAARDPNVPGSWGLCPFLALTGWQCPGCGTPRAVHALAHGDVQAALGLNVLMVLLLGVLVVGWVGWVRATWTRRRVPEPPTWLVRGLLVAVPAFAVARNLPWFTVLAP